MTPLPPLTALIHGDSTLAAEALRFMTRQLEASARRLAGVLEHEEPRPNRARCDMILEELSQGASIAISEDRGPFARGCRLDANAMAHAIQLVSATLKEGPDLLLLNKFGKTEVEGGGFRPLISEALERGMPVLIAVPLRNLDAWRNFAGGMGREVRLTEAGAQLEPIPSDLPPAQRPRA